jgi:hypothetical protein
MKMLWGTVLFVSLAVTSFAPTVTAQTPRTPVGYVLEIEGEWYLNGNTSEPLRRWQKLPAGGTVSIKAPTLGARIVVASLSGQIIDNRDCESYGCSQPITLPKGHTQPSLLRVALDATVDILWGSPDRYKLARVRTFGSALSEGVIKLNNGEIDFGPVLKQTGRNYLRWRARPRTGPPGEWSETVALRKEQERPALVAVSGFKPGLYEVNLQRLKDGSYETFASAWVLVTAPSEYESATESFEEAAATTREWGNNVEPGTSRQFLRAHLDYLAQQLSGKR